VYRFLGTPRWLALGLLMITMAVVMVGLGRWQLARYEARSEINARIDAAAAAAPVPVTRIMPAGGQEPPADAAWTKVTATGVYDTSREILVRGRTLRGQVGFEVLTPLRLADGSAVLVDRGWVRPARGGAGAHPEVPAAPSGTVTVVGRVHPSETGARVLDRTGGTISVRRAGVAVIAAELPYPVYGAYLLADPPEPGFVAVPVQRENAWQNAAYVVQWWLLALLTPIGFGYLARREARTRAGIAEPGYGRRHERAQRANQSAQRD
jgi:cytochrome oxidase assembly protein ShyY1